MIAPGKYKEEVKAFIKNTGGLDSAKQEATGWFKTELKNSKSTTVVKYNGKFFPGKIYVFTYEKEKDEKQGIPGFKYFATVLSLGNQAGLDIGIDLNYLPDDKKLDILTLIYKKFGRKISTAADKKPEDAKTQSIIKEFNEDNILQYAEALGIKYAIRKYETNKRKNTVLLSDEAWKYIPLLNLNRGISGIMKIQNAFKEYIKKLK
jgi:hypothetical protein